MKTKVEKPKAPEDWEVDSALDTLLRAEEIKSDKELIARVQKKLDKKSKAIKSLKDLKAAAYEKSMEDDEDEAKDDDEEEAE